MKKLIAIATLILSLGALAQNSQVADDLYARRGENAEFAKQAAEKYEALAKEAKDKVIEGEMLNDASMAYYFYAQSKSDKEHRKTYHDKGVKIAEKSMKATANFGDNAELKMVHAMATYRKGSNLGKWAEANGIASSLGRWGELRDDMERVIDLGGKELESYGAYRILGRAYYKLPAPLGSKKKSFQYLNAAFKNTIGYKGISNYGLNVIFFAEIANKRGGEYKDLAKKILKTFIDADPAEYNAARIPETKKEQAEAKEILRDL